MLNSPTMTFCPVIDEFRAMSTNACAVSSRSVYPTPKLAKYIHPQPTRLHPSRCVTFTTHHHDTQTKIGGRKKQEPTTFFNHALSSNIFTISSPYSWPHSVKSRPGRTALTRTLGPCVPAKHFIKCSCAALVTLYGILEPFGRVPAIEDVMMNAPPSALALKVARAARMRCVCARTLTAKQVFQSASVGAERSAKVLKRV